MYLVNGKWKAAVSKDEIGKKGECDFLDRVEALSIIGKNVKTKIQQLKFDIGQYW